jgi:hypothetical protein
VKEITISGKPYEVAASFPATGRAIIRYEGLYVFAELNGGKWDLMGGEANDEEKAELDRLIALSSTLDTTQVHVIPPGSDEE